ncbi:pectinesterase inhibitor 10-like [Salvia splendens]|uniref:pectinesterase inhibitor 10-like n=1 Tax=Salvia splendens TaxID=180675 RepID=UPI001C264774|nr:pectinesterase inhibitor 10-like [Salvia splendens]
MGLTLTILLPPPFLNLTTTAPLSPLSPPSRPIHRPTSAAGAAALLSPSLLSLSSLLSSLHRTAAVAEADPPPSPTFPPPLLSSPSVPPSPTACRCSGFAALLPAVRPSPDSNGSVLPLSLLSLSSLLFSPSAMLAPPIRRTADASADPPPSRIRARRRRELPPAADVVPDRFVKVVLLAVARVLGCPHRL